MLFALTIGLGAFLLFLVQPLVGKALLPWFGGAPAVWTTCLLFFQVLLLGGYAWAHLLGTRLRLRTQAATHIGLLLASIGLLAWQAGAWSGPLLPDAGFQPPDSTAPTARLLGLLAMGVGLPYLLLSATSPLLQSWFHRTRPGQSPYRLFALSNAGALLALVAYPFVLEPALALQRQSWAWTGLYLLFAAACCAVACRSMWQVPRASPALEFPPPPDVVPRPAPGVRLAWLLLPATASAVLMATTNQICQEVAVVPLLWVLPLGLYLLSFILAFERDGIYSRAVFGPVLVLACAGSIGALFRGPALGATTQIAIHATTLFACCMVCHGELARIRPHPRLLTGFYLAVALGGALGGAFVALVAPLVFCGYWELHVSLFATALMFRIATARDGGPPGNRGRSFPRRALADVLLGVFGAALLVHVAAALDAPVVASRNFYGVLRVVEVGADDSASSSTNLQNGSILHGLQPRAPASRRIPTTYYTTDSGLGLAVLRHPARDAIGPGRTGLRIGVIGLGVGTAAALVSAGDDLRFYEINPDVVDLARGQGGFFTYLSDSPANIDVVGGDGRLSIERELVDGVLPPYDLLAVDAFTSDAIPTHLLTIEALELYLRRLAPDGVLAFHITNRHLRLDSVLLAAAARLGLFAVTIATPESPPWGKASVWMLLTRNAAFLDRMAGAQGMERPACSATDCIRPWTDDDTSLRTILR
jgi:SAM-dependent methyltransferase